MEPQASSGKKSPTCPRCGNRLRLRPDQLGEEIKCPKCNAAFIVGRPRTQTTASDGDEMSYEPEIPLQRSSIVPDEEPNSASSVNPQPIYDADWSTADVEAEAHHERPPSAEPDYLEIAKEKGLLRAVEKVSTPHWTFFSGVFSFPWRGPNLARWASMSFATTIVGGLLVITIEMARDTFSSMAVPVLCLFTMSSLVLTCGLTAACFIAAVQDSADGHDLVQEHTMPEWDQWFFTFFSIFNVAILSGVIGYPLALVPDVGPVAIPISGVIFFPILLLSALEADSFWIPYSPPILASLRRLWWGWLLFYLLSATLATVWLSATLLLMSQSPIVGILFAGPALAAAILIYARLLGRLAWRMSGTPGMASTADDGVPTKSRPSKKRRKLRVRFPGDFDGDAYPLTDGLPASPPVNAPRRSS